MGHGPYIRGTAYSPYAHTQGTMSGSRTQPVSADTAPTQAPVNIDPNAGRALKAAAEVLRTAARVLEGTAQSEALARAQAALSDVQSMYDRS